MAADYSLEIDGEEWQVRLNYSDSGIVPRPSDDVGRETVYEYDLTAHGDGQRKLSVNFSPRWDGLAQPDGTPIDTPWQFLDREGIDGFAQGSNIHLDDYPSLVARFVAETAESVGYNWNRSLEPFDGQVSEVERYLRLQREMNKKLVGETGFFQQLMMHLAEQPGSQAELAIDNEQIVGKYRALQLYSEDVAAVFPQHHAGWGRQIKSYHPQHVEAHEPDDPLFHPKVGALFRTSMSSETVDWEQRGELLRELDESVLNSLAWSDVPTDVGGDGGATTIFIPDDHFDARARNGHLTIYPDPTPEIEAQQESILMWAIGQITDTDSDQDVVQALATDGGMNREDLADKTGWSMSTLYRVLDRLQGAIESRNGHFRFASRQLARDVSAIVDRIENSKSLATEQAERLLDVEIRSQSNSSFERFLAKYGAEFIDRADGDRFVIRIGTVLTTLKSIDAPNLQDVLAELKRAWKNDLRDINHLRGAIVRADLATQDDYQTILG